MTYKKDINLAIFIALVLAFVPAPGFAWDSSCRYPHAELACRRNRPGKAALPNPWSSEQAGFYYVNASGCSDSRPYGYPGSPRCSIPGSPAAGSKIVIDGAVSGEQKHFVFRDIRIPHLDNGLQHKQQAPVDRGLGGEWQLFDLRQPALERNQFERYQFSVGRKL